MKCASGYEVTSELGMYKITAEHVTIKRQGERGPKGTGKVSMDKIIKGTVVRVFFLVYASCLMCL